MMPSPTDTGSHAEVSLGVSTTRRCPCSAMLKKAHLASANCWGIENNARGTNTNRIVLLGRP